jgi:hypothetical protein
MMSELSAETRETLTDYASFWADKFRTTAMDDALYEEFTKTDTAFAEYQEVQARMYELSNTAALTDEAAEECVSVSRKMAGRNEQLARQRVAVACLKMVEYGDDEGFCEPGVYYEAQGWLRGNQDVVPTAKAIRRNNE